MDPIPEAKNLPFVPSAGAETNAHRGQPTEDSPPLPRAPASSPHEATNSIIAGNCEASLKIGSSKEFFLSSVLLQSLSLFYVVPMMRGISSKKKKKKKKKRQENIVDFSPFVHVQVWGTKRRSHCASCTPRHRAKRSTYWAKCWCSILGSASRSSRHSNTRT